MKKMQVNVNKYVIQYFHISINMDYQNLYIKERHFTFFNNTFIL